MRTKWHPYLLAFSRKKSMTNYHPLRFFHSGMNRPNDLIEMCTNFYSFKQLIEFISIEWEREREREIPNASTKQLLRKIPFDLAFISLSLSRSLKWHFSCSRYFIRRWHRKLDPSQIETMSYCTIPDILLSPPPTSPPPLLMIPSANSSTISRECLFFNFILFVFSLERLAFHHLSISTAA